MQAHSKNLIKNTFIYAIGNLGSKILNLVLVPLYSFYLTKEEFGYYDLVITTITLLIPLSTLQLSESVFRWLITSQSEEENKTIISTGFSVVGLALCITSILVLLTSIFIDIENSGMFMLLLVSSSIYPVLQQTVRGLRNNRLYVHSGIAFSVVTLISTLIFLVLLRWSINALFYSLLLSNTIGIAFLFFSQKLNRYLAYKNISWSALKKFLPYAIPLIPNAVSWWLINSVNKYIVLFYLGIEANGTFAIASRFPAILVMINSIFMLAWQESAILTYDQKERDEFYSNVFNKLMILQLALTVGLIAISKLMIDTLIQSEFKEAWRYLPFLYIGVVFSSFASFYGTGYLSSKNTTGTLVTTLIAGGVNILITTITINTWGLYGAAISAALSNLILWLMRIWHTKQYFVIKVSWTDFGSLILLCVLNALALFCMNMITALITGILSLGIIGYLNKSLWINLLLILQKKYHER